VDRGGLVAGLQIEQVCGTSVEFQVGPAGDSQGDVVALTSGLGREHQLRGGDIEIAEQAFVGPGVSDGDFDDPLRVVGGPFQFESISGRQLGQRGVFLALGVALDEHRHVIIQPHVALDSRRHVPHPQPVSFVEDFLEHDHVRDGVAATRWWGCAAAWQEDHQQGDEDRGAQRGDCERAATVDRRRLGIIGVGFHRIVTAGADDLDVDVEVRECLLGRFVPA